MSSVGKDMGVRYSLDAKGCFVIEQYNAAKPFSNFFPGIAGIWGIPLWVFYVNRGQCIASFGLESKDQAILEFQPANKAYRWTSLYGFRTFFKLTAGGKPVSWEPFQNDPALNSRQRMSITSHDLTISDRHPTLGLEITANYFTIAKESFPALARCVGIKNLSRREYDIEVIDGLPAILAFGQSDWVVKNMSRTVEAWVQVKNRKNQAPFYHLNVEVADRPDVRHITEGNFYVPMRLTGKAPALLQPIVEPELVFGPATDLVRPLAFLACRRFTVPPRQETANRTPSAMSFCRLHLAPGQGQEFAFLLGYAHNEKQLKGIVEQAMQPGWLAEKKRDNRAVVDEVKRLAFTHSNITAFDLYAGQTFLDNVMRGGLPVSLATASGKITLNVFSRKHGDPERDYNHFVLAPTYFSQGNGNYRDVNQNRRNDVWFNAEVKDTNVVNFLNLLQADGFNPLVVKGLFFTVENQEKLEAVLDGCVPAAALAAVTGFLQKPFQPGGLLRFIAQKGIRPKVPEPEFLARVIAVCHKSEVAEHGEGFWIDHWSYNLDLIESFLSVYPEGLRPLLLEKKDFTFYHNTHYVLPRSQRFLLTPKGVRQYHSVKADPKNIPADGGGNKLRTADGSGEVYHTTLLAKLLCLVANKIASLDPSGIGVEMEADRPGWYDALNGLPGLLGSSISETLELKRLSLFLLDSLAQLQVKDDEDVWVFSELAAFIRELAALLKGEPDPGAFWHKENDAKEHYRSRIRKGVEGGEHNLAVREVREFLQLVVERTDRAREKARAKDGLFPTYFYHEVVDYAPLDEWYNGEPYVLPVSFRRHSLPLFLEGFVHALRLENNKERAAEIYQLVKKSSLFDRKLKMYKVNAPLAAASEEIGRARIFPPGWLENESVWLHMEYKYCRELLRAGLYDEFFETLREVLIPFQPAERYGRSILENSSFLVSSSHPDRSLHGQGFVARLSGSTAEFISMWLGMSIGRNPFFVNEKNELNMILEPVLPEWLFTKKPAKIDFPDGVGPGREISLPPDVYAFNLGGTTLVVYHNPSRRPTFGPRGCRVREIVLNFASPGKPVTVSGPVLPAPYARQVRDRLVKRIDVTLG